VTPLTQIQTGVFYPTNLRSQANRVDGLMESRSDFR